MLNLASEFKLLEGNSDSLSSTDLEGVSSWMSQQFGPWNARVVEANESPLVAQFSRADIGSITLSTVRWGIGAQTEIPDGDQVLIISIPLSGHVKMSIDGIGTVEAGTSQARVYKRNAPQTSTVSQGHASLGLIIPLDLIAQRAHAYYGDKAASPLSFSPILDLKTAAGTNILFLAKYLVRNLVAQSRFCENPALTSSLADLVVSQLLLNLPHSNSNTKHVCSTGTVPRVVRRAEEYMQEHARKPISIGDLASAAGCSERTLHKAFRKFRDTTPILALRSVRLEGAKRDLQASAGASVTEVAFKWGFSNSGRFAQAYAKEFGEKPSETRMLTFANSGLILADD